MLEVPCRIALISDNEIVVHGLKSMLSATQAWISVLGFLDYPDMSSVDLTLVDVSFRNEDELTILDGIVDDHRAGAVAIFGWDISSAQAKRALLRGCRGSFNESVSGPELIEGMGRILRGEPFEPARPLTGVRSGLRAGLSQRESEVLSMITWGRTNNEIAETLFLSVNTVKYYVRSAYRKIGVERRAQAVKWGIESGLNLEVDRSGTHASDDEDFVSAVF